MSTKAAAGRSTVPRTAWSASHDSARSDSRPVSSSPPPSANGVSVRSNGCGEDAGPVGASASSQYRQRWNG
ncbi:hypothetical protein Sm713_76030 [Streptomyces sp. TS71-3]|nr:hypothetical protein Sm713_76030 [Streptomyces sp. TS71-3]